MSLERLEDLEPLADERSDLALAALALAGLFKPRVDRTGVITRLDALASLGLERAVDDSAAARGAALVRLLFVDLRYSTDDAVFGEAAGSFLDDVLMRRRGLPISLSLVYVLVGQRMGLDVAGISFPSRFLVRLRDNQGDHILDPSERGRELDHVELDRRLTEAFGGQAATVATHPHLLRPAGQREIMVRMLRNLKALYLQQEDLINALMAVEATLLLMPDLADELRDRGLLYRELGRDTAARTDLQRYIDLTTDAVEAARIQALLSSTPQRPERLH